MPIPSYTNKGLVPQLSLNAGLYNILSSSHLNTQFLEWLFTEDISGSRTFRGLQTKKATK